MRITKKIIQIGSCNGIIIDIPILKKLKVQRGDLVEVTLKKVVEDEEGN